MKENGVKIGLYFAYSSDIVTQYENASNSRYQFIVTPIINPRAVTFEPHCDLILSSTDWTRHVVGEVVLESVDSDMLCPNRIEEQMSYAAHLGLPVMMFNCPVTTDGIARLARIINEKIAACAGTTMAQMWIKVPLHSAAQQSFNQRNDVEDEEMPVNGEGVNSELLVDSWHQWNVFRSLILLDRRVGVVLELNGNLPSTEEQKRWMGEPIKAIILSPNSFLENSKKFPVLPKATQSFVSEVISKTARDVQFIINQGATLREDITKYYQYLEHLKNNQPLPTDAISRFARGYEDYLQIPLQPLMDNLESCTYEIFEKDPVKYTEYQKAITEAMKTLPDIEELVVMVVGAGRGPLVESTLNAATSLQRKVKVYAVEKNPNAVLTLRHLRETRWASGDDIVEVINSDMRDWISPRKADIVVSELLGSFGDNELSPECLDGVWKCVKENAISIPQSYTSFLAPIQSQKIYCEVAALRERDKPVYTSFEWSYVVHLNNHYVIDKPKPLFTFEHFDLHKPPTERDNSRYGCLTFHPMLDTVCHGFSGYFETTLFGNIKLGTVRDRQTPGMFSWFPIYFPLQSPVQLKADEPMKVHFWRLLNKRSVWYEWCVSQPSCTVIHNPNGRSHQIGLL